MQKIQIFFGKVIILWAAVFLGCLIFINHSSADYQENQCTGSEEWGYTCTLVWIQVPTVTNYWSCTDNGCASYTSECTTCYNDLAWVSGTVPCGTACSGGSCIVDNGCAAITPIGKTCWNGGRWVPGTLDITPVVTLTVSYGTQVNQPTLTLPPGGGDVNLNWSVTYAVGGTCTGYGGNFVGEGKPTNGSETVNVSSTTNFELDCWSAEGMASARTSVNICIRDCSCAASTCEGSTCSDGCGGTCAGEILFSTCGNWTSCDRSCGGGTQTRICPCPAPGKVNIQACNSQPCPAGYREVAPW
jgi:hypothetical protein